MMCFLVLSRIPDVYAQVVRKPVGFQIGSKIVSDSIVFPSVIIIYHYQLMYLSQSWLLLLEMRESTIATARFPVSSNVNINAW